MSGSAVQEQFRQLHELVRHQKKQVHHLQEQFRQLHE
jgi:hypothetical protein